MKTKVYWFWARLAQITMQKEKLKSRNPSGEVWVNLIIVSARSEKEALSKARIIGKADEGDCDGSLTLDGKPAVTKFVGIENAGLIHDDLVDGAEILFQMKRSSLSGLKKSIRDRRDLASSLRRELSPYRALDQDRARGARKKSKVQPVGKR